MVATDWRSLYPKAPADLVPAGYSLSGLFDLAPLLKISTNQDLKLDAETARAASPQFWPLPPGRVLDTVVGALESSEFIRQSRAVAEAWRQSGAETRFEEIAAMNHFTIVDGLADPQNPMTARVAELAQRIKT
jgi:arylformamidase